MSDGAGDAAASAAEIQHACVHLPARQCLLGEVDQQLRVGTWDEHVLCHLHRQTVKLPVSRDVSHRLTLEPARGVFLNQFFHFIGGVETQIPQKLLHALAGGTCHQHPRLKGVGFDLSALQGVAGVDVQFVIRFQKRSAPPGVAA